MLKHFVRFFMAAAYDLGPVDQEIEERDDLLVELPEGAIGYCFVDKDVSVVDEKPVVGEDLNVTPYKFFGVPLTRKQVKAQFGSKSLYYIFMKKKHYKRTVLTKDGILFCVNKEDHIIEA